MQNPIPAQARGWVYIAGLIIAAVCLIVAAVLSVLGLDVWQPVVSVVSSATLGLCTVLARANLSAPEGDVADVADESIE